MDTEVIQNIYNVVCDTPKGTPLTVEYMPDMLHNSNIDDSKPHVHTFYEILWFKEGEGTYTIDFQEYNVTPNTIFFISPGQVHHFDENRNYKGVVVKLCADFMREDGYNNLFLKYDIFNSYPTVPYRIDEQTAIFLDEVVQGFENERVLVNEFGYMDILVSLVKMFLIKVYRHGTHEGEPQLNELRPCHRLFIRFRQLVEKEFCHVHTVKDYADRLNVAVRTLNKCVNDCTGMAPLSYINNRIMIEAMRQVRYTSQMVKEIAFNLGFEDPSYFVKFFKRETGLLPTDFRSKEIYNNDME